MTQVFKTPEEFQIWRRQITGTVGFVPTMGALHAGHEELLKRACDENDVTVLSIFVNPTQFNNTTDLEKYPKTWENDLALATKNQVDAIFFPQFENMYPDKYRYKMTETEASLILEGAHRPGHFDGVLSVVMKLFNIIEPQKAYFGEKDFQQLSLIQGMVQSFFMRVEVVPVPTVREQDGLAMSSRNVRLSPQERRLAPAIYAAITESKTCEQAKDFLIAKGFNVEYVTDFNNRRFVAAHLGSVRLIDNVKI